LNITFTDDELEAVRAAAAADGKSLKQFVHDLPLRELHRRQFLRYAASWGERHRAEFDEAFPDEVPPAQRERGADAA
jgi:Xaa-Pro aminopeptidase